MASVQRKRYKQTMLQSNRNNLPVNFYGVCKQCHNDDDIDGSSFGTASSQESLASGADEHLHRDFTYASDLLSGLRELYVLESLCDITLCIGDTKILCHKNVLVAFSAYFRAMFTGSLSESKQDVVTLNGVEAPMVKLLIDFAYTSEINITKENVQSLLSAANLLQIISVKNVCSSFMEKNLDVSNCIGVQCFAESHDCATLRKKAMQFMLESFPSVSMQDEFLNISCSKLIEIISHDELNIETEEFVYDAVIRWVQQDMDNRQSELGAIMQHVRLPLMSPYFLHDCIESNRMVMSIAECQKYVNEAKTFQLLTDRRSALQTPRTRPRKCDGLMELLVSVGGEDDKVVLRSLESYNPVTKVWNSLAALPFAVSKHGLVVSGNNSIYLAGGEFPDGNASNKVWQYNPSLDLWSELASMSVPRSEIGLALLDGFIYAIGGWQGSGRIDSVERYNPATNAWSYVSPMKIAITSPAVVACDGLLYVAGGAVLEDGDGIDLLQCYNPRTDTWSDRASMLIPRSGSVACVLYSKVYVIGGWHASTENTDKVECYEPQLDVWSWKASMHERRYRPGIAVLGGCIIVCGGEEGWDKYHDTMERYDPESDEWTVIGTMNTSRSWLSCATITCRHSDTTTRGKRRVIRAPPANLDDGF